MRIAIFWPQEFEIDFNAWRDFLLLPPILSMVLDSQIPRRRSFRLLGFVVRKKVIPFFIVVQTGQRF